MGDKGGRKGLAAPCRPFQFGFPLCKIHDIVPTFPPWIPGEVLLPSSSSSPKPLWPVSVGSFRWNMGMAFCDNIWNGENLRVTSGKGRVIWHPHAIYHLPVYRTRIQNWLLRDYDHVFCNRSRLCRIPATVADGSRKTWHHGYTRSGWSSAPVDHRTKSGEVFGSNRMHLGTTVGRQRSNLNGHGSKPWHPGEHQNSWYIYIYVYISGCSPPKAWYYRFWLIPISTSMKWSLVTSSLSTHRLQDSTASLNGSQWYDGYEFFPTFQAQWSSSGPL